MPKTQTKTRKEIQYRIRVNRILKNIDDLKDGQAKEVLKLLEKSRKRTIQNLVDVPTGPEGKWTLHHLKQLKKATEEAIVQFGKQYQTQLTDDMARIWDIGKELVDDPLDIMGVSYKVPRLDLTSLKIAQAGISDLAGGGLVPELTKAVNLQVQLGLLGEKTPFQMMQAIGAKLDKPGPFGTIATRAETITRTELGRVQNLATSKRIQQTSAIVPGLMHQWLWSHNFVGGRPNHAAMHGRSVPAKEDFILPNGVKMKSPHDPGAPASEIINCGCSEVVFMKGWPSVEELNPKLAEDAKEVAEKGNLMQQEQQRRKEERKAA